MIGVVLATMTISYGGHTVPSLHGLRTALLISAGVAALAAVIALTIPGTDQPDAGEAEAEWVPRDDEITEGPLVRG